MVGRDSGVGTCPTPFLVQSWRKPLKERENRRFRHRKRFPSSEDIAVAVSLDLTNC